MRIVLDTNVFIAAALKSGLAEDILHMAAEENLITLVVSSEIISELAEKLKEKFKWQDIDITLFADS
jgi:putative PIN family toxin of toxin-antitoxin system